MPRAVLNKHLKNNVQRKERKKEGKERIEKKIMTELAERKEKKKGGKERIEAGEVEKKIMIELGKGKESSEKKIDLGVGIKGSR